MSHTKSTATDHTSQTTSVSMNLPSSSVPHELIMNGGVMEFDMTNAPTQTWASADGSPVNEIKEDLIVAVPYVVAPSDRFKHSTQVSLKAVEPGTVIYYTLDGSDPTTKSTRYTAPFNISKTSTLKAVGFKNGQYSHIVSTPFFLIPTDKTIKVLSKIHPQFDAGGPDALIDGIRGQEDFRLGAWQSHYPGNLEAIVDLKTPRALHKLGLSVLQDLGVWIWYPTQVEFLTSNDGKTFTSAGVAKNTFSDREYGSFTQVLSLPVDLKARFVKVVAANHGIIPDWHPGKGEPCHIFADEIIIE